MKLGTNLGYFGVTAGVEDARNVAAAAERLGFDSIWCSEAYSTDAVSLMGFMAAITERVKIGSAIMAIPGRTATMTAQTAVTLDMLSGNRTIIGLGTSGPQVAEGWHGQAFAKQLTRTREYVEVIRMALRREVVSYEGETIQLPRPGGAGKALKMIAHPPRADTPIYLAAMGPKNTALCGEICDGWLPLWYMPEHAEELNGPLNEGIERAGRSPGDVKICPGVNVMITDDPDSAIEMLRHPLALYVGGMGSRKQNFYNALIRRYGYEDVAEKVQDLYLDGNKAEAAAELPAELVDKLCLIGSVDRVAERLKDWAACGVDTLMTLPAVAGGDAFVEQLELIVQAAEQSGVVELAS